MKIDVRPLVAAHYRTLVDARSGRARRRDYLLFVGCPVGILIACLVFDVNVSSTAAVGMLTVSGLLAAFLFGVMLQVSERAMSWADEGPARGRETSEHAILLAELAANAGYASLVSIIAAVAFVIASVTTKTANVIASSIGLAIGAHMLLVLLMVMVRVFAVTESRLRRARTGTGGGTVTDMDKRRLG